MNRITNSPADVCDTVTHTPAVARVSSGLTVNLPDPRAAKSRHALGGALLALLERRTFEQVTVRDIAAAAGVHYATFFRHYPSKEALLDDVATDEIDRLVALTLPVLETMNGSAAFLALATYVGEHRQLWSTLLTGGAAEAMRAEWLRVARQVAVERAPKDGWLPVELAVSCTVGLIVTTISWWLAQPRDACTPAQLAQYMACLVVAASSVPANHAPD